MLSGVPARGGGRFTATTVRRPRGRKRAAQECASSADSLSRRWKWGPNKPPAPLGDRPMPRTPRRPMGRPCAALPAALPGCLQQLPETPFYQCDRAAFRMARHTLTWHKHTLCSLCLPSPLPGTMGQEYMQNGASTPQTHYLASQLLVRLQWGHLDAGTCRALGRGGRLGSPSSPEAPLRPCSGGGAHKGTGKL